MSWLLTILEGIFSIWGWFKSNKDQQVGQQKQELADAKNALDQAAEAAKIGQKVGDKTDVQLNADLDRRVHRDSSYD